MIRSVPLLILFLASVVPLASGQKPGSAAAPEKVELLTVEVFPVGAAVYIDREFHTLLARGEKRVLRLKPGKHEIVVSRSGYHDHVSQLVARAGTNRACVIRLAPLLKPLPSEPHRRILRPGMTARGQLTARAPLANVVFAALGAGYKSPVKKARAVRFDLESLGDRPVALELMSHGARMQVAVVDDKGKIVARHQKNSYRVKLTFSPVAGRRYHVVASHSAWNKAAIYDLVRYVLTVVPHVPARESKK